MYRITMVQIFRRFHLNVMLIPDRFASGLGKRDYSLQTIHLLELPVKDVAL